MLKIFANNETVNEHDVELEKKSKYDAKVL